MFNFQYLKTHHMSTKLGQEPAFPSDHEWTEGGKDGLDAPVIIYRKSFGISKRLYLAGVANELMHYYSIQRLASWFDAKSTPNSRYGKRKTPYLSFINSAHEYRIAKFHPSCLSKEYYNEYFLKAIEALKILNLYDN